VVAGHDGLRVRFHDGVAPVGEPVFEEVALVDDGGEVLAAGFNVIDGEVLDGGGVLEAADVVALVAAPVGDGHAAGEVGIFAEDLLDAAPAGVAADVDDGRTEDEAVGGARTFGFGVVEGAAFVAHGDGDGVDEARVPGGSHGGGDGEEGCGFF